jgi:hypothetical protein
MLASGIPTDIADVVKAADKNLLRLSMFDPAH